MKKISLLVCFLATALLLTGCGGGKKLVCHLEQKINASSYYIDATSDISMGLDKDDYISDASAEIKAVVPESVYESIKQSQDPDQAMQILATYVSSSLKSQYGDNVDIKTNVKKNVITISMKIPVSVKKTRQEAIDSFTAQGYTCK